jgi:hypothetical protein
MARLRRNPRQVLRDYLRSERETLQLMIVVALA